MAQVRATRPKDEKFSELLRQARGASPDGCFFGWVEAYCENEDCNAREVVLHLKEYTHTRPRALLCPLCGRGPLKIHGLAARAEEILL